MRAILLPSGKLLIPVEGGVGVVSRLGLAEIGPEHPDFGHWLALAEPGEDPRPRRGMP